MVATPSCRPNQSAKNSWMRRRDRRMRSDKAQISATSIGPARWRSLKGTVQAGSSPLWPGSARLRCPQAQACS